MSGILLLLVCHAVVSTLHGMNTSDSSSSCASKFNSPWLHSEENIPEVWHAILKQLLPSLTNGLVNDFFDQWRTLLLHFRSLWRRNHFIHILCYSYFRAHEGNVTSCFCYSCFCFRSLLVDDWGRCLEHVILCLGKTKWGKTHWPSFKALEEISKNP